MAGFLPRDELARRTGGKKGRGRRVPRSKGQDGATSPRVAPVPEVFGPKPGLRGGTGVPPARGPLPAPHGWGAWSPGGGEGSDDRPGAGLRERDWRVIID